MQYALNSISIGLERNISKTAGDGLETPKCPPIGNDVGYQMVTLMQYGRLS